MANHCPGCAEAAQLRAERQTFEDQLNDKLLDLRRVEAENAHLRALVESMEIDDLGTLRKENAQLRATLTRARQQLVCDRPCPLRGDHEPDCIIAEVRRVLGADR